MARAELVRLVGGLDENLNELTDWDFFIRLAETGRPAACDELVVGYLVHPQNRRLRQDSDVEAEFRYLAAKHPALERAGFSRWRAVRPPSRGSEARAPAPLRLGGEDRDPGNVLRAAAALVGERAFRVRRSLVAEKPTLTWLDLYR